MKTGIRGGRKIFILTLKNHNLSEIFSTVPEATSQIKRDLIVSLRHQLSP